jgi:hypothetical protein
MSSALCCGSFWAPERIHRKARLIAICAVGSNAMPPGNVTEMTGEERGTLAPWLEAGPRRDDGARRALPTDLAARSPYCSYVAERIE